MKVIIFDFDGTIADTFDAVLRITNRIASELGHQPPTQADVVRLRNLDSRQIIKQSGIPLFRLPLLMKQLKTELGQEIQHLKPIAGMKEAIIELGRRGHALGIVTSNSQDNVSRFLVHNGLEHQFGFVYSGTTLFGKARVLNQILKQRQLKAQDVVYVGDETRDIEAAKRINIRVIAVSWGFNTAEALIKQQPDHLVQSPNDLVAIASQL